MGFTHTGWPRMHAFLADQQAYAGSDNGAKASSRHFDGELCAQNIELHLRFTAWVEQAQLSLGRGCYTAPRAHVRNCKNICFQILQFV